MSGRWPSEPIPSNAKLFMRVHKNYMPDGEVTIACFRNHGEGMSTDWSKYSTAEECRARARNPQVNAVIEMGVGCVREIPGQTVVHTPIQGRPDIPDNRAHTDVYGEKRDNEIRVRFRRCSTLVLPLP
jgi:hypothetical protein